MSKPAEQKESTGPKEQTDSPSKSPENWPDVPEDRTVENLDKAGNERVEQMRHADDSDALANSATDTSNTAVGYSDALVDEELDTKGGREELI